jgi:flagellar motor protein MotB
LLDTVFIEGHTDSVPNNREMGNWGLSTYRAISLWKFWTETPGQLSELKRLHTIPIDPAQNPKPLISVSGYADTRSTHGLIDGKGLREDRPEDRRIDIRFTLVSSEKKDLEELHKNLYRLRERTNALIHNLKGTNHAR